MIKNILFSAIILTAALGPAQAQRSKQGSTAVAKKDVKFLEDITIDAPPVQTPTNDPKAAFATSQFTIKKLPVSSQSAASDIENAGSLQLKFAQLLDLEVEQVQNLGLFKVVDEWLGTRYKLGGSTRDGIDCSAFMQTLFTSLYSITLPRTAHEQYDIARKVSLTELREGDLVFFNTIGGVSHVGMYLQNNKFVHASKNGVTISDLYEDYWLKHLVGVGRVDNLSQATVSTARP
jgi:lipoprotein Spr